MGWMRLLLVVINERSNKLTVSSEMYLPKNQVVMTVLTTGIHRKILQKLPRNYVMLNCNSK